MNDNDKKFVLEHFGLFLAAGLMGGRPNLYSKSRRDNLEHRLDSSLSALPSPTDSHPCPRNSVSFPVYWRSSLFHDDVDSASFLNDAPPAEAPSTVPEDGTADKSKPMMDLLFLDATFLFQTQLMLPLVGGEGNDTDKERNDATTTTSQKSTLSLSFGAFLRRQNPQNDNSQEEYFYVQSPPVTTEFLIDHFNQHGSLVADTSAIHVANPMIRALKRLSKGATANVKFDEKNGRLTQACVPLVYDVGGEEEDNPSYLTISPRSGPVHPLDSTVASTWLCSILSQNDSQKISLGSATSEDKKDEGQSSAVETGIQKETILSTRDSKTLLAHYNGWKEKAGSWLEQCKEAAATRQQSSSHSEENQDSTAVPGSGITAIETTVKSSSPSPSKAKASKKDVKKKRPQAYGAQRIGGKKKKKTTATFAPVSKPK